MSTSSTLNGQLPTISGVSGSADDIADPATEVIIPR